jgi:hypothetical protein
MDRLGREESACALERQTRSSRRTRRWTGLHPHRTHKGETKIGRVTAYKIGDAKLFFHDRGAEKWIDSYEVWHFVDNVIHPKK